MPLRGFGKGTKRALVSVMMIVAAIGAGVALADSVGPSHEPAKEITGSKKANHLVGTNKGDIIRGYKGNDVLNGRDGADVLLAGPGKDEVRARDGEQDRIDCGPGKDVAIVDRNEDGTYDCEKEKLPGPSQKRAQKQKKVPKLKHIFTIILENENADTSFGPDSEAPYLAKTLPKKGELLKNYYATGHLSLDNYISMISGQAPNVQTQTDCQNFTDFNATLGGGGQWVNPAGGCVYPPTAQNIGTQLESSGYTWHEYAEDMNAAAPKGQEDPCRHPAVGARDDTQSAEVGDQYATRHNPFVYFHAIIDSKTCKKNVVDLSHLSKDLKKKGTTPNYSFITPNLCSDGHDEPCVDGKPGGLKSANVFLEKWVPKILGSPGFKNRGLLIVTFDEAEASGGDGDSSACCNEKPGPNLVPPATPGFTTPGPGGGKIGAVLVSPCIKPGTTNTTPYNHYSMLRSIEDNFKLPHLGYAGQNGLEPFGAKTLNRPSCGE